MFCRVMFSIANAPSNFFCSFKHNKASYDVAEASSGQDSDVDSSHSFCSGSDTHSGHTSLSGVTEKGSIGGPSVHVSCSSGDSSGGTLHAGSVSPGAYFDS